MPLCPLGARLTATQAELIRTDADDFFALRAKRVEAASLRGRQRQAMAGVVLGAVSDDQDLQPACEPAARRPLGVTPVSPKRLAMEPAMSLEPAHALPAIVPNPLQQGLGRVPGVTEDRRRATAPAVTGIPEPLQSSLVL
jgi:hypothetical protein